MLMAKVKPNARNVLTRLRLNGGQLATEAAEVIETLLKRLNDANDIIHRRERAPRGATRPEQDLATPPPDYN
jgi:DNA-binding TFAR19-related protein (PDSD5 family)